jgi:TetR/AcrR family fatty acid metabolism transcriptional regulator
MALLLPMLYLARPAPALSRDEKILSAAEAKFARCGFGKNRISEIARLAEIAEGTLYEHFKSKEDLQLSIPLRRFREPLEKIPEIFQIESPDRKLRRLLRYHFTLYGRHWDSLKIFLLDIQFNRHFYVSEAYKVFQEYIQIIEKVIAEGINRKCFRPEVNPRVFRNMFLGAFTPMALRWIFVKKDTSYNKMKEIDQLVVLLTSAVSNSKPEINDLVR